MVRHSPTVVPTVIFLAGIGGMAVSFVRLQYPSTTAHILEYVCLWTSAFASIFGMVVLHLLTRSEIHRHDAYLARNCISLLLLPFLAWIGWPLLYFTAFLAGICLMFLAIPLLILIAWHQSRFVANQLCVRMKWNRCIIVLCLMFLFQTFLILASHPFFVWYLDRLETQGYKVGWS
jgi:hypothetical protein